MRFGDLIHLPLAALWQQKMRTFLTTLGVVFGSFVLAASLSVGQGVQNTIERISHRSDLLRKITIYPNWDNVESKSMEVDVQVPGEMDEEKRERIRAALKLQTLRESNRQTQVKITQERFEQLKVLEHVEDVIPSVWMNSEVYLGQGKTIANVGSAQPNNPDCLKRLVAGQMFESLTEHSVVVNEFLLYRLGIIDDAAQQAAVGQTLRLEYRSQRHGFSFYLSMVKPDDSVATQDEQIVLEKIREQLPAVVAQLTLTAEDKLILQNAIQGAALPPPEPIRAEFRIAGVMRLHTAEEEKEPWDPARIYTEAVVPSLTAADLLFSIPDLAKQGINEASIVVDREANVKAVAEKLKELGFRPHAPLEYIERERLMYLMIFGAMTCVAAVALLVAALGIANTMLMSVLERTREIGIMKAVGAGNGTLQFLFLTEGAFIGILGGTCGLLLAWGASFPGDAWVRSMVSRDMKIELKESIFVFPYWLAAVVLTFTSLVTTLAAVLPARRAASIDPVRALRHE